MTDRRTNCMRRTAWQDGDQHRSQGHAATADSGQLPSRLYETLPALYVIGGVLSMIAADSMVGLASGAMLAVAGATIFRMRWLYRRV